MAINHIVSLLQEKRVLFPESTPLKEYQRDLAGGVPIVVVQHDLDGVLPDFIIYSNVTTPDGKTLIQGEGMAYYGTVVGGNLQFQSRRTEENSKFGVIGVYPDDYYIANRQFLDGLK